KGQGVLLYWDINGATANSGGAAPSGTWDTSTADWTTSSGGTTATINWNDAVTNNARFSAGTDASGAYTITLSGTRTVGQIFMNNAGANVTLTGGALNMRTPVSSTVANINFQQAS